MTDPQVIDSQMADVYASMFGDGYQNHKTEVGTISALS
jgi:hypothetical protein